MPEEIQRQEIIPVYAKLESIAEKMVEIRVSVDNLTKQVEKQNGRVQKLEGENQAREIASTLLTERIKIIIDGQAERRRDTRTIIEKVFDNASAVAIGLTLAYLIFRFGWKQ